MKIILYLMVPVILAVGAFVFMSSVKINTQDTVGIGVGFIAVLWVAYFLIQRFFSKAITKMNTSQGGGGFKVMTKDRIKAEQQSKPAARKFYSQGLFQIVHKGQRYQDPDQEEKLFKMPVYKRNIDSHKPETRSVNLARFGTAGIRGMTNSEITPLLVLKMSEIYGAYLSEKRTIGQTKVAIGYDSRYGAEMLALSAISGLNSAGVQTVNCGCITTGGLASYITCNKLDGGVLITGSHMPHDMVGFIILTSDGSYLDIETSRELEKRFDNYSQSRQAVRPEGIGINTPAVNPSECYRKFLLGCVDVNLIKSKKYRVLLDPVNGPATLVFPDILKELGCEVFLINDKLAPVPNRPSEPRAKNLVETVAKVLEYKCDIGIATDIDADRVLFIDAAGQVLSEDLVGGIFAREVVSSDKVCVVPVNSSGLIEEVISKCSGKLEYCRIGQPETIKAIKQSNACFSYEESGKYYFSNQALWPDALLSSLKLLEIMARLNKPLAELASEFSRFYQVKHTIHYDAMIEGSKKVVDSNKLFQKIQELWAKELKEKSVRDVAIDGLKRIYDDRSWLLIRKSGTEPLIRVYADAPTQERAEQLVQQGEELVKKAVSQL
ncbi:MAG TPA: hypothetical protein VJC37_03320 [Planctomycetota bacterium]|nr:hypothetical protein [Planctomycetota bacterium]